MTELRLLSSLHDIPRSHWQALYQQVAAQGYPFLRYEFLAALEDSGCIGTSADHDSGWQAGYLMAAEPGQTPELIVPCFAKQHSYGEYVFDWRWAEAYEQYGLDYYPKRLCAIPFTPATGPRLLYREPQALNTAVEALNSLCAQEQSSGWHLNFPDAPLRALLQQQPELVQRQHCQFHWFNRGYEDFEHFLSHFSSRKRKNVRKERQRVQQQGIRLERKTGASISDEDIAFFFRCYQMTYARRRSWPYLNEAFFRQLVQTMPEQILLVLAKQDQQPVAAAWYFYDADTLYGRYWGALDDIDALHFEACYYQGIEFCLQQGLQRFDPGTQGEHKIARGFEPITTYSYHQLLHPGFQQAIGQFAAAEAQQVSHYRRQAAELLPFSHTAQPPAS